MEDRPRPTLKYASIAAIDVDGMDKTLEKSYTNAVLKDCKYQKMVLTNSRFIEKA